jgi:hypothetical protein
LRAACQDCGGAGFVPTGLTMEVLSRIVGSAAEAARLGGAICRIAREGAARRRSGQGRNGNR